MKIRLDAVIAEIAANVDAELLQQNSDFETLPRFNRLHFILRSLGHCNIAQAERSLGRKIIGWDLPYRFKDYIGRKARKIPHEFERIEAPKTISMLADEFEETLQSVSNAIEQTARRVLRRFEMYEMGMLEYRGKENGLCQFRRSAKAHEGSR